MSRAAMQKAFEALERVMRHGQAVAQAKEALRIALAESEREPVIWADLNLDGEVVCFRYCSDGNPHEVPLYDHPHEPLTDDEIAQISVECAITHKHDDLAFARAIEKAHGIEEQQHE